jgi:hypothetical protein
MKYLCNLSKKELLDLNIDELRIELYKTDECISEKTLQDIRWHLYRLGLEFKFSIFIQDYENEIKRKYREQYENEKKQKKSQSIPRDDGSLLYWSIYYPEHFEKGTLMISNICNYDNSNTNKSSNICTHTVCLEYINNGEIVTKNFLCDAIEIANFHDSNFYNTKLFNITWRSDTKKQKFENKPPIKHFEKYLIKNMKFYNDINPNSSRNIFVRIKNKIKNWFN